MMGICGFAGALPMICAKPVKAGVKLSALNFTVSEENGCCGVQVADQRPLWKLDSASGGSPFENEAATAPDDCGSPMSSGAVAASFSNGDPPLALSSFQSGRWSATWTPQHPFSSLTVKLSAESFTPALTGLAQIIGSAPANPQIPIIGPGGVVGAASYLSSPAPGTLISLFGSALAERLAGAGGLPLPDRLATTSLILKGALIPLIYVSENQINALVPYQLPAKAKSQIIVQRGMTLSAAETVAIFESQPAVFTTDQSGKGQGHIYIVGSDGAQTLAAPTSPATAGDVLTVYCAGLGEVQPTLLAGVPAPSGQ